MIKDIILYSCVALSQPALDLPVTEYIEPEMVILRDHTIVWASPFTGLLLHDSRFEEHDNDDY